MLGLDGQGCHTERRRETARQAEGHGRVAIYARASADGAPATEQLEAAAKRALLDGRDSTEVVPYRDAGMAGVGARLEGILKGNVRRVVVTDPARLGRTREECNRVLAALERAGASVVFTKAQQPLPRASLWSSRRRTV